MSRAWSLLFLFCAGFAIACTSAHAAAFRIDAASAIDSWDESAPFGSLEETGSALSQYLAVRSTGRWNAYRLQLDAYGRGTAALQDAKISGKDSRLYTFLLKAARDDGFALALGRQELSPLTGPVYLDGMQFTAAAGRYRASGRWGFLVDFDDNPDSADRHLGLGIEADLGDGMVLGMDYGRTYGQGRLLSEFLAADWVYSWFRYTNARVLFNYDLMSKTLHDAFLGSRLFFSDAFSMEVEYNQKVQSFDSDSIYSVFSVEAPQCTSFSLLFTPSHSVRYAWEYALESYGEGSGSRRYGVSGIWSPGATRVEAGLFQHKGYGGNLTEIATDVAFKLAPSLSIAVGGESTRSQNENESTAVSSYAAHLRTQWTPSQHSRLNFSLEQSESETEDDAGFGGRLSFSMEL